MSNYENVVRTPLYFGDPREPLFGWYHAPKTNLQSIAIVICPPIGYEYIHAHRSLRHLADQLAQSGISSLRFDYHGIGDSAGVDEDPDRTSAWLSSIKQAINTARLLSGCENIGLIGFRMGATFAAMVSAEVDLACLILWAPCLRGRNYSREMKALRMTGTHKVSVSDVDKDIIEGGGFVLTNETIDALSKIDLHQIQPKSTKILLLMRDDLAEVSQKLDQWLEHGLQLESHKFSGYADMVAEPHYTIVPFDTIENIAKWIRGATTEKTNSSKNCTAADSTKSIPSSLTNSIIVSPSQYEIQHIKWALPDIREIIFPFGENNRLFGILSEPLNDEWKNRPIIILPNAGSVHHVGPNRLYTLLSRNITRAGFRCLRMDLSGLGDSFIENADKENDSYVASSTNDIASAIGALRLESHSFVVMGLCSGAHAAFHVALDLKQFTLVECILINPLTFYWKEGMSLSAPPSVENRWHYYKDTMRQKERWMKLMRGEADIKAILQTIIEKIGKMTTRKIRGILNAMHLVVRAVDDLNHDVEVICATGRKLSFAFSSTDPGYEILMSNAKSSVKKYIRKKLIEIDFVEGADHTFTTRVHRYELTNKIVKHLVRLYQK